MNSAGMSIGGRTETRRMTLDQPRSAPRGSAAGKFQIRPLAEARLLDKGRADVRSTAQRHFKKDQGAHPAPLPCAYLPRAPRQVSAETLGGAAKIASRLWRHLPLPVTRVLGSAIYGFFA
jgi:hypothetical protein